MSLYVYRCPLGHETNRSRPMDSRDASLICPECSQETKRVLYPGVSTVDGFKAAMKRGRYNEAGKRLLNSQHGDPLRRKQYFPIKG